MSVIGKDENTTDHLPPSVEEILRGTAHALTLFAAEEKAELNTRVFLKKAKP